MAHRKTKHPQDEAERLREEFDRLRTDLASLARELTSYAEHEQAVLGDKASERVVALRKAGEQQLDLARRYAVDAGRAAETTVRTHPGYAVAGAAALGFVIGALTLRRR